MWAELIRVQGVGFLVPDGRWLRRQRLRGMKVLFMIWSGHGFEPGQVELAVRSTFKVVIFISGLSIPGLNKISNARGVIVKSAELTYR